MASSPIEGGRPAAGRGPDEVAADARRVRLDQSADLLSVRDLKLWFHTDHGVVKAVDGVTLRVRRGETLGIVGESGSGKSVTNLTVMRLLPSPPAKVEGGSIAFDGEDLLAKSEAEMRAIRGNRIAMIFQDPMTSLNPFLRISDQLTEVLALHTDLDRAAQRKRCVEMLEAVGIPDPERRLDSYPHEFSGGMRQRVMIAMALLCDPDLLVADEPTTALDVTIQAQILELLKKLRDERDMAVVLVTHDLGVVAGMADRVVVMYAGRMMETAGCDELFANPRHPYTLGLLRCLPRLDDDDKGRLYTIRGMPADPSTRPDGCPFHPRCPVATDRCRTELPGGLEVGPEHISHCHYADDVEAIARAGGEG